MRNQVMLITTPLLLLTGACKTVNTLPPPVSPTAPVEYSDLEVPADLEIRAVDFSASTFAEAMGAPGGGVSSSVGGRAFVKVHAVHRTTGEQFLLLYEDITHRRRPIQVIRFREGGVRLKPDSTG